MVFRVLNALMAIYFAYAAVVQLNDPDWLRWAVLYAAAAVLCVQAVFRRGDWRVASVIGAIGFVWALLWLPSVLAHPPRAEDALQYRMVNVAVEEVREMLGLFIVAVWMGVIVTVKIRSNRSPG